tara:strand:- start:631 stop:2091 length:1461 start_codon:yes stop_codon:yes gene_type:complete
MKFSELEQLMLDNGITALADIARFLKTTPQAVSNWKARDHVPYHIIAMLQNFKMNNSIEEIKSNQSKSVPVIPVKTDLDPEKVLLSDILLIMAEQIKVIFLFTFLAVFLGFTYEKYIKKPIYSSYSKVLLPSQASLENNRIGSLSGLASQFGVNIPNETAADLSSPLLYPEIIKSRIFAEKLLKKEFYLDRYQKRLKLIDILIEKDRDKISSDQHLTTKAFNILNRDYIEFINDQNSPVSIIRVRAAEPLFARDLANEVLIQLESLNRYFKSQNVNEKINFINNRISSVSKDLRLSEIRLKNFNEQNRQISSPSLQLELDRLAREVEIQKEIYLTLKQQLELAKIEEVQKASVIQILDYPQISTEASNKNVLVVLLLSIFLGLGFGIAFAFIRSYAYNKDINERKKIRRIKRFVIKKSADIIYDRRIAGIISCLMIIGSPFYIFSTSTNPSFFGMYSSMQLCINILYLTVFIFFVLRFIKLSNKSL